MEWRPYAASYVPNTFESFCKKVDFSSLDVFRPKEKQAVSLYRPTTQDVEAEFQKFEDLRKKVAEQRKRIREQDDLTTRSRALQREQLTQKLKEEKRNRRLFFQHVRSFAGNTAKASDALTPLLRVNTMNDPKREEDSSFFSLTVVDPVTESSHTDVRQSLRRSLLPAIRVFRNSSQPTSQRSKLVN